MNRGDLLLPILVVIFGASGTYLLLPHKHGATRTKYTHTIGAAIAGLALLLFLMCLTRPGQGLSDLFFFGFSALAVAASVMTITARDPTHSALWFAAVILATSGLFLLAGASFLAAGTVIVYAGAIIVTFLFVIMLAQMEGRAPYDRAARTPLRATLTCYLLLLGLFCSLFWIKQAPPPDVVSGFKTVDSHLPRLDDLTPGGKPEDLDIVVNKAVKPTSRLRDEEGRFKPHVAGLGETLFTDHLITVELAGGLLFVALIGAVAIAAPRTPVRPNHHSIQS
ncbi:MAG: hypothetical protein NVSMB9_17420 [Isosphaeraceae bacterium]